MLKKRREAGFPGKAVKLKDSKHLQFILKFSLVITATGEAGGRTTGSTIFDCRLMVFYWHP
jgi:hypothetical protein